MTTSIAIVGTSSGTAVDVNNDNAMFVDLRSPAIGTNGVFSGAWNTGNLTAGLGSTSKIFSLRWTNTTHVCLIRKFTAIGIVTGQITTAVIAGLKLTIARNYTTSDSGGTDIAPAAGQNKLRTSMGDSLILAGDLSISGSGITAGSRTLDNNAIGWAQGSCPSGAGGVGAFILGGVGGYATLLDRTAIGLYPLKLAANEGFSIILPIAAPADGTIMYNFQMEWIETAAY